MTKIQNTVANHSVWDFEIVSYFGFRASNLESPIGLGAK
jgi:hypothetical protein